MIVRSRFHRLDPSRAIFISGTIDQDLLSRVAPEILRLQSASRDPITLYIDSPGGSVSVMETLLRLLNLSDQDAADPCHIITAVATRAASAAADLLSSGDYAVAYPGSTILYHGVRTQDSGPLTLERTSAWGWFLRLSNDRYAMTLARKIEERFSFRFITNRHEFDDIRTGNAQPWMSDLECFIKFVEGKLSDEAKKVWARARDRHARYESIFATIIKKTKRDVGKMTRAQREGASIKAIVDFEIRTNRTDPSWSFRLGGLQNLADDFYLLTSHLSASGHERLKKWSTRFGKLVLPKDEVAEIEAIADGREREERLVEKVEPILEPLWSFFIGLCHALQDGENELTGRDAYWMGLVDEVVGESLLSVRTLVEFRPDPLPDPEQSVIASADNP